MGISYGLRASFHLGRSPMDDAVDVLERCRDHGFAVAPFDDDETVDYALDLDAGDEERSAASRSELAADAAREGISSIEFDCRFDGVECELALVAPEDGSNGPEVYLSGIPEAAFAEGDGVSAAGVRRRADRFVDFVADVAATFDAWYAFATDSDYGLDSAFPRGRPPESGVSTLAWVTVFGPSWARELDGVDRLVHAPAYETRTLDGGGVLLRKSDRPAMGDEVDEGPPFSAREYVFDGLTPESLDTEMAAAKRREELGERLHRDPFRSLADGEVGSDPVMCQYDAPFDVDRIDYDEFPDDLDVEDNCFVLAVRREGDALYGVENDEFVRRLVDDDGEPLGELPADWPSEHEMVSLSIAVESLTAFAPRWFYMPEASSDHVSTFAELSGLRAVPSDMQLWEEIEASRE